MLGSQSNSQLLLRVGFHWFSASPFVDNSQGERESGQ